jgi:hypothetical protein
MLGLIIRECLDVMSFLVCKYECTKVLGFGYIDGLRLDYSPAGS